MKKIICILLMIFAFLFVTGCGGKKEDTATTSGMEGTSATILTDGTDSTDTDVVISSEKSSIEEDISVTFDATEVETDALEAEVAAADSISTTEDKESVEGASRQVVSPGVLTAGEWNDNENWGFFANLVSGGHLIFPTYQLSPIKRVVVNVTNAEGPVQNANVILYSQDANVIWEAVTNYQGIAYTFYQVSDSNETPSYVTVLKDGISATSSIDLINNTNSNDGQQGNGTNADSYDVFITLDSKTNTKALDIMFMFDTTGSMGDELLYLQKEFENISQRISNQNTRFSVGFYRDEEDQYVVKSNEFTADINEITKQLNDESADGGGDYPEAVEKALYNGIFEHSWNKESVKLLFLILDAPPHGGDPQINDILKKDIEEAAKQGIRIIPIASSGVDKETETFLRTVAILTGGTYTFLTDDSGIGYSHLEPTIGSYKVEFLNDCIVRLINLYYQ